MADAVRPQHSQRETAEDLTLRGLMAQYQSGNAIAAEKLVERLSPLLLRFLAPAGYSRAHVEDVLQECWMRIHKARHSYRPNAPVLPWIYAIARHTRLDAYRHRYRAEGREVALDQDVERDATPTSSDGFTDQTLIAALNQLPEAQREVVFMLKVSGMTLLDIARATSSTTGAVKQKAHRAYESLRRILGGERHR